LLRRSWYLKELESRFPWLIQGSNTEVEAFESELFKFEHDQKYNPAVIQARFESMIASFIHRALPVRPVYVTAEIEPEFTRGLQRAPQGLAFRLFQDSVFHHSDLMSYTAHQFARRGRLEDVIPNLYTNSYITRGKYYYTAGRTADALYAFERAALLNPASEEARRWLQALTPPAR